MSQSGFRITYPALLRGVVLFALVGCDEPFDEGEDILDAEGIATATQALCSQPQLASSSPGPMPPSSSVLLTASGVTCSPPGQTAEYRFLYQRVGSGSGFTQFRGWSTNRTATFSNAGRPSGQYRLQVRVRNVGSSQPFDSSAIITIMSGNVCHAVALTAAPAPPQLPGTLVALTASATCTPGPAEYRFLYRRPGESTLRNLRGWGGRTFSWNTAGRAIGEHELVVRARAAGNASYESSASIPYRLGIPNRPPTITSNGGGSVANLSVYENMPPSVATVVATDPDPGDTVTYSISGGSDAARFTIQPWGDLAFVGGPPDYETPADANGDNVYEVEVQASDGALADLQLLVITVTDVFDDPIPVTVLEGLTFVTNVVRIHPGMPLPVTTYQIVGGADAAQFTIDATTGRLSFVAPPEYEAPADVGLDNVYEVTVRLLDGFFLEEQRFRVAVTDFAEGGSPISVAIPENTTEVTAVVPRHPALLSPLTFSITGGLDAQFFTIDAMSGRLSFAQPPDYEWPLNARFSVPFLRTVNVYEVEVGITDGSLTETQPFLVIVTDVFEPFLHSVPENQVGVTVISARSRIQCFGGCLFWGFGIVGGSDAQRFEIDQVSGQLSGGLRFAIPVPDYERPMDANGDNVYEVAIRVLGIGAISNHEEIQVLHVTVTNVNTPDDFPVGHVIA
jgi:hypothetical protein